MSCVHRSGRRDRHGTPTHDDILRAARGAKRLRHTAIVEDIMSVRQTIKLHPAAPPANAIIAEELQSPHATNVFRTGRQSSADSAIDYTPRHVAARELTHHVRGRESVLLRALTRHQITTCLKLLRSRTTFARLFCQVRLSTTLTDTVNLRTAQTDFVSFSTSR